MVGIIIVEVSVAENDGIDVEDIIGTDDEVLLFVEVVSTVDSEDVEENWTVSDRFWVEFINGVTSKVEKVMK